jgi:predicted RNA-binding protein with RPS1 domain
MSKDDKDWSDYEADGQRMNDELGLELPQPEPGDLVSNEDIANAVRRHLKMPDWVQVAVVDGDEPADPGKWSIRTTDIAANGEWCVDGRNPDGTANIGIYTDEQKRAAEVNDMLTKGLAKVAEATEQHLAEVHGKFSQWLEADVKVTEGVEVNGMEVEEPSDDDLVSITERADAVENSWRRVKTLIQESLRYGDPELMNQAREVIPTLGRDTMNLLDAMNRAIERAE